jgi:hypothetical protein
MPGATRTIEVRRKADERIRAPERGGDGGDGEDA